MTIFEEAVEAIKPLALTNNRGPEYVKVLQDIALNWDQEYVDRMNFFVTPNLREDMEDGDLYILIAINSNCQTFYRVLNKHRLMAAMFNDIDAALEGKDEA